MNQYLSKGLMQEILAQKPPYRGFGFGVTENDFGVLILVALEEFARFPQQQQETLAVWIGKLVESIRAKGIPCYLERIDSLYEQDSGGL